MDNKEEPMDRLTASLGRVMGVDITQALQELHDYQYSDPVIIMSQAQRNKLIAWEANTKAEAARLKDKLKFNEPGELTRLLDKFIEVVKNA